MMVMIVNNNSRLSMSRNRVTIRTIMCNHPTFFDDNEDHYVQYKEYLENSSKEIAASNSNQEKEGPPQDSDIRQLITEECCIKVCRKQKKNMEETMLELVEVCHQKEFYCMHDNVDDLIESALNSKLLSINLNSQRLDKEKQEVKNVVEQPAEHRTHIVESLQNFRVIHKISISLNNTSQISPVHAIAPILSTEEPEYSLSMGYKHLNTTPEMESDEIIKSGVEELVPIPSEYEEIVSLLDLVQDPTHHQLISPTHTPNQEHQAKGGTSQKGSDLDVSAACPEVLSQGAADPCHQERKIQKEKRRSKGWRRVHYTGSETRGRVCPHSQMTQGVSPTIAVVGTLGAVTRAPALKEQSVPLRIIIEKERPHTRRKLCQKVKVAHEDIGNQESYDDLKEAFLENFRQQKKCIKDPVEIYHIKHREAESTKDFVHRQKRRSQAVDKNQAIQEEVKKLVDVDFKDLNKACPKDGYSLSEINWKVESLCGFPFKCFLDAYKGYNEIKMAKEDEEKTTFITSQGVFCYSKMPFDLKNAREQYQHLMDKTFHKQIDKNLKVYVDDLVIKRRTEDEIIRDIEETFKTLREVNMKLNPKNDVQKLNGKLASLNMFLDKSAEKSLPFFKTLKKCIRKSDFHWTEDAEFVFKQIKHLIAELPTLTAMEEKEELIVYLAATNEAVIERPEEDDPDTAMDVKEELSKPWILFTDGSSSEDGSRAGLIFTNLEGAEFTYALSFRFEATNNEAKNEALIAGLRIAKEMGVKNLQENVYSSFAHLSKQVLVEELKEKSINELEVLAVVKEEGNTWMTPIYEYLTEETLPAEVNKARVVRRKSQRFIMINEVLYKESFLGPWLRCIGLFQDNYVLREIHERSYSMHACTRSVVAKALGTGYYWPTMHKSARALIRACQDCQEHCTMIKSSNEDIPFSLTYGTEAVIPAEIGMPILRTAKVDMVQNNKALEINMDLLEERREHAATHEAKSKARMDKYNNSKVRNTSFKPGA
nr:reverse transcriptase domain-containing protein [Tanacetum cinerariifolium]